MRSRSFARGLGGPFHAGAHARRRRPGNARSAPVPDSWIAWSAACADRARARRSVPGWRATASLSRSMRAAMAWRIWSKLWASSASSVLPLSFTSWERSPPAMRAMSPGKVLDVRGDAPRVGGDDEQRRRQRQHRGHERDLLVVGVGGDVWHHGDGAVGKLDDVIAVAPACADRRKSRCRCCR